MERERSTVLQLLIFVPSGMVQWLQLPSKGKLRSLLYRVYLHDGFFLNIIVVSLAVNMLDCSFQGVVVLSCDLSAQTLSIAKVRSSTISRKQY